MDDLFTQATVYANDYVRQWREGGGRVVGYNCVFAPLELFEAAGLLPYRIRALSNAQTDLADAHLSRFNCGFCRSCLQLGLNGAYDFLDGLIEINGCDHLRGAFENWQYVKPTPFFHYLKVPHIVIDDALDYFADQLVQLKANLEAHFAVTIADDALRAATARQARVRELLRRVYALRERERPGLTGAQTMALVLLGSTMPSEQFIALLEKELAAREHVVLPAPRARLLIGGAATDEVELLRELESLGALFVTDSLCYGARAFWPLTAPADGDPLRALAKLYLSNTLCPRMFEDYPSRRAFILAAAERARIDGAVFVHNKFCDVHGIENVLLRKHLEEQGIPVLLLEKEYGAHADRGRLKTRLQAFLERIGRP